VLAEFGAWDWGVVGLYLGLMVYMGVVAAKKNQNTEEYFLADRSMPTWAVAVSIVATTLSAATFVGVPDLSYGGNLSYLVLNIGGLLSVLVVATLFVPKLYRAGTVTIYGYLNTRYGETARIATSLMFLFGRTLASAARLFIAALPLCLLIFAKRNQSNFQPTTGQLVLAICMIGLVGTFYTMFGGVRTVVWIDNIQFLIVIGAALLSVGLLLYRIPVPLSKLVSTLGEPGSGPMGHSKLRLFETSTNPNLPFTLWAAIFGTTFLSTAAYGVDQDLAQRFLVAKSVARGGLSLVWAQVISIIVVSFFMAIGLLLYIFYQRPDIMGPNHHLAHPAPGDYAAYPWFILNELPTVVSGIAIAGFFAIAQGSMDSAINALASSAVADIYHPLRRRLGYPDDAKTNTRTPKYAVAAMGIIMVLIAILCALVYDPRSRTLIDFALGVMAFAFTGMLGVFLTALLTKRGNTVSVLAALMTGVVTVTLLQPQVMSRWTELLLGSPHTLASTWWMPVGTVICFLVCVAGSPRVPTEQENVAAMEMAGGRQPQRGGSQ
jgi:SSS family transporter